MPNIIDSTTRRNIFDIYKLQNISWYGALDNVQFLNRIFDLKKLPTNDSRHSNAEEDITRHTIVNDDWDRDWIFSDTRFNLLEADDSTFLLFICTTLHPTVRGGVEEAIKLKNEINTQLAGNGYEIYEDSYLDYKPVFKFRKITLKPKLKIFIVSTRTKTLPSHSFFPCLVLRADSWNDFGYVTMFDAFYFDKTERRYDLGQVKILQKDQEHTSVEEGIERLSNQYISLGQSISYYEILSKLPRDEYEYLLENINDVVFDRRKLLPYKYDFGWEQSLLRFSEAVKAFEEAGKFFNKEYSEFSEASNFTFSTQIEGYSEKLTINFDFDANTDLPNKINVVIGKNGTGKTQLLANLANSLSGFIREKEKFGVFSPTKPLFSKIIAISYSVFDRFELPDGDSFSYVFCGIRNTEIVDEADGTRRKVEKILQKSDLKERYTKAIESVIQKNRSSIWEKIVSQLLEFEQDISVDQYLQIFHKASSGEAVLLNVFTNVIANIENESLLLVDEPELHLHPNAITNFSRMLQLLLEKYKSYSVITTHSPVIVQEVPSKYITVLSREGSYPIVKKLDIESFGENLTVITNEIFQTNTSPTNYKEIIKTLAQKYKFEEINNLFSNKLSFNARIYLDSLYEKS